MTAPALLSPASAPTASVKDDASEAAKMLEAYFLRRIMAEVRNSSEGGLLAPGFGGEVFSEMLDGALADRMAEGGGFGLAAIVKEQLTGEQPTAAALPTSARAVRRAYAPSHWHPPIGGPSGTAPWQMPVQAERISSGFGKIRLDPTAPAGTRTHKGIDMTAPTGAPVHAARGGQVIRAEASTGGFGNVVVIDHGSGIHSYYGHLSAIGVKEGDMVETGAPIGEVGSTGRSSGPHLHFEVRRDGVSVDPTSDIEGLKIDRTRTNR